MRSIVGMYHGVGFLYTISIRRFQERFGFLEDDWSFEAIKKDFYRNGMDEMDISVILIF